MTVGVTLPVQGSFTSIGPFVAKNSTRKEGHRGIDVAYQDVNLDERTNTDDDTVRARDLTNTVDWDEKIIERRELLDQECCDFIKATATQLLQRHNSGDQQRDRDRLRSRAYEAWCKACFIPEEIKECLDAEVKAATIRWETRVQRIRQGYAKAAGSSMNSVVQQMEVRDYALLEQELLGIVGRYKTEGVSLRTAALRDAFDMTARADIEWNSQNAAHAINLLTVLRGSKDDFMRDHAHDEVQTTDDDEVTNRDIIVDRDQDITTFTAQGKWYQNVIQSSDTAGEYEDAEGDIDAAVSGVAGLAQLLLGGFL